jgi:TfoX/Sxy family transcriptional regulator of competence genes
MSAPTGVSSKCIALNIRHLHTMASRQELQIMSFPDPPEPGLGGCTQTERVDTMAFDQGLAQRIREVLAHPLGPADITEKKMFGGLAFLVKGNMFVGIVHEALMARVGLDAYERALAATHVRPMDFTGRPMKGYVFVDPEGLAEDSDLAGWVTLCLEFAGTLPVKASASGSPGAKR